jgi:HK97 family phage major capsid protein
MEINKIGIASRVLHAGPAEYTALAAADRSVPTTSKLILDTRKIMAETWIPYDVLEDNIEQSGLEATIMSMLTEHASLDLEELLLKGDTTSSDPYLALSNGVIKLASVHTVNYATPPTDIDYQIFKAGIQSLPSKYLRLRNKMRFYVSHFIESEYAASMAARMTVLGDSRLTSDYSNGLQAFGVPIAPCSNMPNGTCIFTDPQNIILGIQRKIQVETDKDIRGQYFIIVLSMRIAIAIEEPDAVVKITGLVS